MWTHVLVFAAALAVLVKSADWLVEYAARLARRFGVSDLIVGLVITSVGTSLPELASSLAAAVAGSPGLVIGNVVGSNIANIGLVLGVAAALHPLATGPRVHERDGFILIASSIVFFGVVLDNRLGRVDAAVFLVLYVAYVVFAARTDREGVEHRFQSFLKFVFDFEYAAPVVRRLRRRGASDRTVTAGRDPARWRGIARELAVVVASLAALIANSRFAVAEAIWTAQRLGVPENLIGISLVAVGTSLPELLVAVSAARKGKAELVIGNVVGSNIANTLLILGVAGAVRPLQVSELSVVYTVPIMLFASLGLVHCLRTDWRISRAEGLLAVCAYVAFLALAFVQGWE